MDPLLVVGLTLLAVVVLKLALVFLLAGGDAQRVGLAIKAYFRMLRDPAFAEKVKPLLAPPPPPEPPKPTRPSGVPLWLLTLLQREGRLVDFLLEDIQNVP